MLWFMSGTSLLAFWDGKLQQEQRGYAERHHKLTPLWSRDLGPTWSQALLTKGCTDSAKESPVRSGWMQPASACQTTCTTTTCSLPALLPITSAQPLDGHLGSQTSFLPCCSLLLMQYSGCYLQTVTPVAQHGESQWCPMQLLLFSWGREAEAENNISFSRGQRADGFAFTSLLREIWFENLLELF